MFAAALPGATVVDVLVMMIVDIVYIESFTSIAMMISILWEVEGRSHHLCHMVIATSHYDCI